jgi:hypothetical protein
MTPDDLALKVAQMCRERFSHNDAALVIDALAALGYTFEVPGLPGRIIESDEVKHSMTLYLVGQTKLPISIVRSIVQAISITGLNIREPDQHPSGLKTTAHAFSTVKRFGAQHAAAQKPIDDRMPGHGRNYA